MSCRHDLALGNCSRCYPGTGRTDPGPEEDYGPNMEGPGAVPRGRGAPPAGAPADAYDLAARLWEAWDGGVSLSDGTWQVVPTLSLVRSRHKPATLSGERDVDLWVRMAAAVIKVGRGGGGSPRRGPESQPPLPGEVLARRYPDADAATLWEVVALLRPGLRCRRNYGLGDVDCPEAPVEWQGERGESWCDSCKALRLLAAPRERAGGEG